MSFSDRFSNVINTQINTSIGKVRGKTKNRLTDFVTGAVPNLSRKIPGAAGSFLQRELSKRVGDGVGQILGVLDISVDTKAKLTNPKIFQNGVNAAKGIWTQIENGNENVDDIVLPALEPLTLLSHTDIMLGMGDIRIADQAVPGDRQTSAPRYSPYAMDLFRLAPKHKFLFVTEFVFTGPYVDVGQGKTHKNEFALVIKDFERPKIKYEYEPSVNYYNFRTPIVKRVIHEPLMLKFLDDRQNVAMKFFHEYLKATHPLTSVAPESAAFYEDNGMNWNSPMNSASSSVLTEGERTIIKEIKVYHLYDFGAYMNVYHFTNPKVLEMNLDNWNMHESEGSELSAAFGYDGLFIELGIKVDKAEDQTIATLSNAGNYPMHPMQVADRQVMVQESRPVREIPAGPGLSVKNAMGTTQSAIDETQRMIRQMDEMGPNWQQVREQRIGDPAPDYILALDPNEDSIIPGEIE